jgi:hypothetical protein
MLTGEHAAVMFLASSSKSFDLPVYAGIRELLDLSTGETYRFMKGFSSAPLRWNSQVGGYAVFCQASPEDHSERNASQLKEFVPCGDQITNRLSRNICPGPVVCRPA